MRKIILLALIIPFLVGCEDETDTDVTSKDLYQTTWRGVRSRYNSNDEVVYKANYIFQFLTDKEGMCVHLDSEGEPYIYDKFRYFINGKIISFSGTFEGKWTVIEKSKNKIVLQAYLPDKRIMVLTKEF